MSHRAGYVFAGLATICVLSPRWSRVERVLSAGIVLAIGAMVLLGLTDYLRCVVGAGIWLAISVEVVLVAVLVPHVMR